MKSKDVEHYIKGVKPKTARLLYDALQARLNQLPIEIEQVITNAMKSVPKASRFSIDTEALVMNGNTYGYARINVGRNLSHKAANRKLRDIRRQIKPITKALKPFGIILANLYYRDIGTGTIEAHFVTK